MGVDRPRHPHPRREGREFFAYGGDFGEELHDGNFVADGLLFPDRTPSPGLHEFAKVIEPVRITADAAPGCASPTSTRCATSGSCVPVDRRGGRRRGRGGRLDAGRRSRQATASSSTCRPRPDGDAETWLTVRAVLAADEPWAPAGHEIAWGQVQLVEPPHAAPAPAPPARRGALDRRCGPALRPATGCSPGWPASRSTARALDAWRAPTDNDRIPDAAADAWRAVGLHRLRHRVLDVPR